MRILLCTDGSEDARQAAAFVGQLRLPPEAEVRLLAVVESGRHDERLDDSLAMLQNILEGHQVHPDRVTRVGKIAEEILEEASEGHYDLVAIGAPARHGLLTQRLATTASRLAHDLRAPLLIARSVPASIQHMLLCTSGEGPAIQTLRHGGRLVSLIDASVSVVHVMSQVTLSLQAPLEDLTMSSEEAIEKGTREGRHLMEAVKLLRESGVSQNITPRLRHGLVVDEILEELREGNYDLLVVGAHTIPARSRWMDVMLDDITNQFIARSPCSVLVIWHDPKDWPARI